MTDRILIHVCLHAWAKVAFLLASLLCGCNQSSTNCGCDINGSGNQCRCKVCQCACNCVECGNGPLSKGRQ